MTAMEEEFTRQLQNDYGLDPSSGAVTPLAQLRHLNDAQRETARILRETLAHYRASDAADEKAGLDRIVREQAFTVVNRLAALRMAEARGLVIESVGHGYQAKGFQLYARLAGAGLGETGDVLAALAAHFGLPHLDTGLLYRAVAAKLLDTKKQLNDSATAAAAARALSLDGLDAERLSGAALGEAASRVAAIPEVRAALLAGQPARLVAPAGRTPARSARRA